MVKYQPYKGYTHKPWLSYGPKGYPRRIRTKSDWHWEMVLIPHGPHHDAEFSPPRKFNDDTRCRVWHCFEGGNWKFWQHGDKNSTGANWEKRVVHRAFRHQTREAIRQELAGNDGISHAFFVSGNYLD